MADADKLEMVKDGTVRAFVDGKRYVMRRPKIGEYRKLRELAQGMDDAMLEVAKRQIEINAEREAATAANDEEKLTELRGLLRGLAVKAEDLRLGWLGEAQTLLGDKPLPPADELPAFFLDPKLPADLLEHWRDRPLAPGAGPS